MRTAGRGSFTYQGPGGATGYDGTLICPCIDTSAAIIKCRVIPILHANASGPILVLQASSPTSRAVILTPIAS
jgi:hypothetical protein